MGRGLIFRQTHRFSNVCNCWCPLPGLTSGHVSRLLAKLQKEPTLPAAQTSKAAADQCFFWILSVRGLFPALCIIFPLCCSALLLIWNFNIFLWFIWLIRAALAVYTLPLLVISCVLLAFPAFEPLCCYLLPKKSREHARLQALPEKRALCSLPPCRGTGQPNVISGHADVTFSYFLSPAARCDTYNSPNDGKLARSLMAARNIRHAASAAILKFRAGKDWKSAALGENSNAKHICCCSRQIQRSRFGQGVERRLPAGSSLLWTNDSSQGWLLLCCLFVLCSATMLGTVRMFTCASCASSFDVN